MLINAEVLDTSPPEFTVRPLFPRIGVGHLVGPSYTGKSLLGFDLALAVANGTPFLGHPAVQGNVIYCLSEGQGDAGVRKQARLVREQQDRENRASDIEQREGPEAAAAWLASLPPYTDERLFISPEPYQVPLSPAMEPTKDLRKAVAEMQQIPDPELVVFDVASGFTGLSLSNDTSAKRFMNGLKWLQRQLNCLVLTIAHPNKDGTLPGINLFALADFVYVIERDMEGQDDDATSATITAEKVKCGSLPDPIPYVTERIDWPEPARDPDTRELIPGAEPVPTYSFTVRRRDDEQASAGGLRLPGKTPRAMPHLPRTLPAPEKPRKRSGILPRTALRTPAQPEPENPERTRLAAAILSVPCSGIAGCDAGPGQSCKPGIEGTDIAVLGKRPLMLAHVERMTDAIVAGKAGLKEVTSEFGDGSVAEPETQPA